MSTVSASAFTRGQTARCFEKVGDGPPVAVLKNNALLELALSRIERNAGRPGIPAEDVNAEFGIAEDDLGDFDETVEFA